MCRLVRIDGRATPTIDTSSPSRKTTAERTISVAQPRRDRPGAIAPGGTELDTGTAPLAKFSRTRAVGGRQAVRYCSMSTVQACSMAVKQQPSSAVTKPDGLQVIHAISDPV